MAEPTYPNGELLVSADWLAEHLHDAQLKIVDARSEKDYTAGHIPGALLLPDRAFRSTSGVPDICSPEEFAATAGALGISADDRVVCYDAAGPAGARAWWAFARFGHRDVRFLNGGFRQWTAGEHPVATDSRPVQATTYDIGAAQDHLVCSLPQAVNAAVNAERDGSVLFWDVRSAGEFSGADPRNNPPDRAGHLPHAAHLEWTEMVDPATGLFKPADEMQQLLVAKGITRDKAVVTY